MEEAIDLAMRRWPGETRSRALLRLIDVGARQIGRDIEVEATDRRVMLEAMADKYGDTVTQEQLEELREDWPV